MLDLKKSQSKQDRVKAVDFVKNKGIEIVNYVELQQTALSLHRLKPIDRLIFGAATCKTVSLDMMWHLGRMFSDAQRPHPN